MAHKYEKKVINNEPEDWKERPVKVTKSVSVEEEWSYTRLESEISMLEQYISESEARVKAYKEELIEIKKVAEK